PQYIMNDKEWKESVDWFADPIDVGAAIVKPNALYKKCKAELQKAELLAPAKPLTLRQMCEAGAKKLGVNLKDPVYKNRLDHELKMIEEKKFGDYFHILADIIGWSKRHMVVGPAR